MTSSWEETTLPTILSKYDLEDIYNADEFGLFFKALPNKSLHLKSEKCVGGKHSKVRLTGLAAANANGKKLPMFVIGKSAKQRCFKGIKHLPCRYRSQKKSWMDSTLFEEWVRELDRKFTLEKRKIALIVDNCTAHPHMERLQSINLIFLPPNTTCKTQPMDQGVIRATKAYYRAITVQNFMEAIDAKKPLPDLSILDAMNILVAAWARVSEQTVQNCFKKGGISQEAQKSAQNDDDDPFKVLVEEMDSLKEEDPDLVLDATAADVLEADGEVLTSDSLPPSDRDILAEFLDTVGEQDEDVNEDDDEIEIVNEPPERSSMSSIRNACSLLLNYSMFIDNYDDSHWLQKQVLGVSNFIEQKLIADKRQRSILNFAPE